MQRLALAGSVGNVEDDDRVRGDGDANGGQQINDVELELLRVDVGAADDHDLNHDGRVGRRSERSRALLAGGIHEGERQIDAHAEELGIVGTNRRTGILAAVGVLTAAAALECAVGGVDAYEATCCCALSAVAVLIAQNLLAALALGGLRCDMRSYRTG